jgi:hypothetical protein
LDESKAATNLWTTAKKKLEKKVYLFDYNNLIQTQVIIFWLKGILEPDALKVNGTVPKSFSDSALGYASESIFK